MRWVWFPGRAHISLDGAYLAPAGAEAERYLYRTYEGRHVGNGCFDVHWRHKRPPSTINDPRLVINGGHPLDAAVALLNAPFSSFPSSFMLYCFSMTFVFYTWLRDILDANSRWVNLWTGQLWVFCRISTKDCSRWRLGCFASWGIFYPMYTFI